MTGSRYIPPYTPMRKCHETYGSLLPQQMTLSCLHRVIIIMDRVYINYQKFQKLMDQGVVYVIKMKKNLTYETLVGCININHNGQEQVVVLCRNGISHIARIITYVDIKKNRQPKLTSLLTNDFDMSTETIVNIYHRKWKIESLFKQIKLNLPLRYFYGENAMPTSSKFGAH